MRSFIGEEDVLNEKDAVDEQNQLLVCSDIYVWPWCVRVRWLTVLPVGVGR